jgi:hypothetical protein
VGDKVVYLGLTLFIGDRRLVLTTNSFLMHMDFALASNYPQRREERGHYCKVLAKEPDFEGGLRNAQPCGNII